MSEELTITATGEQFREAQMREYIAVSLGGLADYYQTEVSVSLLRMYYLGLKRYSPEQIDRAVEYILRSSKFFPKIADFVQAIEGTPQDRGAVVWQRLLDLLETTGGYQSVESYDPAWSVALDRVFGSWIGALEKLRNCSREIEAHHKRNAFIRAYEAAEREIGANPPPGKPTLHTGLHEAHNRTCGGDLSRLGGVTFKQIVYVLHRDSFCREEREFSAVTGRELTAQDRLAIQEWADYKAEELAGATGVRLLESAGE